MVKESYTSVNERDSLVADYESRDWILREEANITEGNFLTFATSDELQPELTQDDYLIDLDYRLSMIELGL